MASSRSLHFLKIQLKTIILLQLKTYAALKNPIFKQYFQFLSFVLSKFTNFNKLFQSETPNIHFLSSYLATTYKGFLSCYMSPPYIRSTTLDQLDPTFKLSGTDSNEYGNGSLLFSCTIQHLSLKIGSEGIFRACTVFLYRSSCSNQAPISNW